MIYLEEDPKEFSDRFDICAKPQPCKDCGTEVPMNIPFAIKGYRGLESGNCPKCGAKGIASSLVPVSEEKVNFWYGVKSWVKGDYE